MSGTGDYDMKGGAGAGAGGAGAVGAGAGAGAGAGVGAAAAAAPRGTRRRTLSASGTLKLIPCAVEGKVIRCQNGHVYKVIRTLRECIYGKVRVACICQLFNDGLYHQTSQLVALKIMSKERIRSGRAPDGTRLTENPHDELRAMQYLSDPGCPNLLTLIEVIHNAEYLIAVLEYAPGGELFDVVTTAPNGRFTEDVAKYYFKQLMTATAYMHTLGVAHRDMSLENMLVATGNVGKVIDFGLCVELPRTALGRFAPLPPAGAVGKIFYMAPEVFRGNVPYWGHLADVWSCGVMLFIMLTGVPVFKYPSAQLDDRFKMVAGGGLIRLLKAWGMSTWFSADVQDLLFRMLKEKASERPTAQEVLQHRWLGGTGMPATLNNMTARTIHDDDAAVPVVPAPAVVAATMAGSVAAAPSATAAAAAEDADMDMDMDSDDGNPPTG